MAQKLCSENEQYVGCQSSEKNKKQCSGVFHASPVKTRRLSDTVPSPDTLHGGGTNNSFPDNRTVCILCEEWGDISLHKASTLGLDDKVRRCAMICQDKSLIAKLSAGDLIAINAEYHLSCLTKLHHKPQSELNKAERNDSISVQTAKVQAFSDLVEYIECQRGSDIPVLHMSLGLCISATRLKTISTDLANSVVAHYESCGFFVPPAALHAVFTILQADNFDHNPSSTTCGTSFHGHSISFLQYPITSAYLLCNTWSLEDFRNSG